MSICPKCKKNITFLDGTVTKKTVKIVYGDLKSNGFFYVEDTENVTDDEILESDFSCPLCNSILFKNVEEARAFLKENKQTIVAHKK